MSRGNQDIGENMKRAAAFLSAAFFVAGLSMTADATSPQKYVIAVHGGAGVYNADQLTDAQRTEYKAGITQALLAAEAILAKNGTALDAAEAAVAVLEDNPLFNAGKGAVLTADGTAELDASIMDGATLKAGAVTRTTTTKNPIKLARAVMDKSEHVMLAAEGADAFAKSAGLEQVPNDYFITDKRRDQLKKAQGSAELMRQYKLGTVGAVVRDRAGNLAAATSTGGMTNKKWGRVGDSPIIGAGTYADNKSCAVSGTGWGEYFIRATVARSICALVEYKRMPVKKAARTLLDKVQAMGGDGGVIVLDAKGNMALDYNTPGMFRGTLTEGTQPVALIRRND
jgi:L-asparaginase / beta-aspartyl-peptidase